MKRTNRVLCLLLVLAMALAFAGCGSSKSSSAENTSAPGAYYSGGSYSSNSYAVMQEAADYDAAPMEAPMAAAQEEVKVDSGSGLSGRDANVPTAQDMSEKIIYNADVTLETTKFDEALEKIAAMVSEMGGYLESSSISGSNYNSIARGNAGLRNAYYTIRVPSRNFNQLTGSFTELGNVPYSRTYTRNITTQYYDTQSRLDAYRVQETRLLEMLAIAETVEDMLAIQRELTDVQYEIDSLTGTLRYYDNQVGYSTVELTVQEVREYTPTPVVKLTYWERMAKEFKESVKDTVEFFKDLFLWFVTSLPWLIPLCLVIWLAVKLIRRRLAKNPERAARRQARREEKACRRAEKKARKAGASLPPTESKPTETGETDSK